MQQWARFAILGAMFVTAYLLILAWQKDYGHAQPAAQPKPAAVVAHDVSADLPNSETPAATIREALKAKEEGREEVLLFNLSGHGLIDMAAYEKFL